MELIDAVMRLAGPIDPIGETNADGERYHNLNEVIELTEALLVRLSHVAVNKNRGEFSMNRAGKRAFLFLQRCAEWTTEKTDADIKRDFDPFGAVPAEKTTAAPVHSLECKCGQKASSPIVNGFVDTKAFNNWYFSVETGWLCPACAPKTMPAGNGPGSQS